MARKLSRRVLTIDVGRILDEGQTKCGNDRGYSAGAVAVMRGCVDGLVQARVMPAAHRIAAEAYEELRLRCGDSPGRNKRLMARHIRHAAQQALSGRPQETLSGV